MRKNRTRIIILLVVGLFLLMIAALGFFVRRIEGTLGGYEAADEQGASVELSIKASFYKKIGKSEGYTEYNLIRGEVSISPYRDDESETGIYKLYGPILRLENQADNREEKNSSDIFIANGWRYNSRSNTITNISVMFDEDFKRVLIKENLSGDSDDRTYIGFDMAYESQEVLDYFEPYLP